MTPLDTAYVGRLVGVELEYFVVDSDSFMPVDVLDRLDHLDALSAHVKPEFCAEQIEVVSPPFSALAELERWLVDAHLTLVRELRRLNARLLPVALLDTAVLTHRTTPRYAQLAETFGDEFRRNAVVVASDQVNLGATNVREAFVVLEAVRRRMPELLALSLASPLSLGMANGSPANRLHNVEAAAGRFSWIAGLPAPLPSLGDYLALVARLPVFGDANVNYAYVRPMPHRGVAAEIRCLDKQPTLSRTIAFAALGKGIVLDALASPPSFDGFDEDDLAMRFERARQGTLANAEHLVDAVWGLLPEDERHYLRPLSEGDVSAADSLLISSYRHGLDRAYRRIADAFETDLTNLARRRHAAATQD